MILKDFALIASDTSRTKAYLQLMIKNDIRPELCVIYTDDFAQVKLMADKYEGDHDFGKYFNRDIPLLTIISDYELHYIVIESRDINSEKMVQAISSLSQMYLIYSGYGGGILKPHLFKLGKRYIHIHAGMVPKYRGSTTAYYSILDNGNIGVTAFFLDEGLDDGELICQHEYDLPDENVDIDYIYEPYLRACELVKALALYVEKNKFETITQDETDADTYFIIHPVLKHIAMKRIMNGIRKK